MTVLVLKSSCRKGALIFPGFGVGAAREKHPGQESWPGKRLCFTGRVRVREKAKKNLKKAQPRPQGFSLKKWVGPGKAFPGPTHFLREKPWGRGWAFLRFFLAFSLTLTLPVKHNLFPGQDSCPGCFSLAAPTPKPGKIKAPFRHEDFSTRTVNTMTNDHETK